MAIELTIQRTAKIEVKFLRVDAGVRYWEDARVNGVHDEHGEMIPFRVGDRWQPTIEIESGVVINWPAGTTADVHYKVCDDGIYTLLDSNGMQVCMQDGYVPSILSPDGDGYGDYIIMQIDGNGKIAHWRVDLDEFSAKSPQA